MSTNCNSSQIPKHAECSTEKQSKEARAKNEHVPSTVNPKCDTDEDTKSVSSNKRYGRYYGDEYQWLKDALKCAAKSAEVLKDIRAQKPFWSKE